MSTEMFPTIQLNGELLVYIEEEKHAISVCVHAYVTKRGY